MDAEDFERFFWSLRAGEGSDLDPDGLARALRLRRSELARLCRASAASVRTAPNSARVQRGLRDIVRVLRCAHERFDRLDDLAFWFNHYPLQRLGYRTPCEACANGQCQALVRLLGADADEFESRRAATAARR